MFYTFLESCFRFSNLVFRVHALVSCIIYDLCVKTTLNSVTLVFQETGDKKKPALWCFLKNEKTAFKLVVKLIRQNFFHQIDLHTVV